MPPKARSAGRKKPVSTAAAPTGPVTTRTGLTLDPADPGDAQIMARQAEVAREAGSTGQDRDAIAQDRPDLGEAYDEGAAEPAGQTRGRSARGRSTRSSSTRGRSTRGRASGRPLGSFRPRSPARVPTRAQDAGGFLTGLALYTVVIIYIRYGPEGWKGWLAAKFLNRPMTAPPESATTTPTGQAGGGGRVAI